MTTPEGRPLSTAERVTLAVVLLAVDLVAFALPITAIAAAYIILARPSGFPG